MSELTERIVLDSRGYSSGVREVIRETGSMIQAIEKAKENIINMARLKADAKIGVNTSEAEKHISNVKNSMNEIKKNIAVTIAAKDLATSSIKRIKSAFSGFVGRTYRFEIAAIDKTKSVLSSIKNSIFNLKTLASGIVIGIATGAAAKSTVGAAARLEQEEVSMKHFIKNSNSKADAAKIQKTTDAFIANLRTEANLTPFGTNEVLSAGRRAINIQNGDTKKAMTLVKLAEDMAALNPGKSVMDSMEALADLKTGEFERMKEFGFKITAEEFKGLVGKGAKDNLSDKEMTKAYDLLVKNKLNPTFKGGAQELSKTAAGQWSTTTGNLEAMGADLGKAFLPSINKILVPVNAQLDKLGRSKAFANLQKQMSEFASLKADNIVKFLESLEKDPSKLDAYKNKFKEFMAEAKNGAKTAMEFAKSFNSIATELKPLISFIGAHPKLFMQLFVGYEAGKGALGIIKTVRDVKKEFGLFMTAIGPFKSGLTGSFKSIGGLAKSSGKDILNFGKSVSGGIKASVGPIKLWAGMIGSTLKNNLLKTVSFVSKGIINAVKPVFAFLAANPVVIILGLIVAAVVLLHLAWKNNWGGIREKTKAAVDFVKTKIDSIKETFTNVKTKLAEFAKSVHEEWEKIRKFLTNPIKGTVELLKSDTGKLAMSTVGKNALGTPYWRGGPTWVGEHGPEILNIPSGSSILSNRESRGSSAKKDVNVYLTVQGNVIGNEEFADSVGEHIVTKVKLALGNM